MGFTCIPASTLRVGVHRWIARKHIGYLRRDSILQNANSHEYVHREPGNCGRVFPYWYSIFDSDNEQATMDIW